MAQRLWLPSFWDRCRSHGRAGHQPRALRIPGEHLYETPPMALPDAQEAGLLAPNAVQLF